MALFKREVPETIFLLGLGRRHVAPYFEEDKMCGRYSRWNHQAWNCQLDPRCRFCGKSHLSTHCGDKIRAGQRVVPRCCNCSGHHNAQSPLCPNKPRWRQRSLQKQQQQQQQQQPHQQAWVGINNHKAFPRILQRHLLPTAPPGQDGSPESTERSNAWVRDPSHFFSSQVTPGAGEQESIQTTQVNKQDEGTVPGSGISQGLLGQPCPPAGDSVATDTLTTSHQRSTQGQCESESIMLKCIQDMGKN